MHNLIRDFGYILITSGVLFNLAAAIAVVRFSKAPARLVASTKALAFGTLLIIAGAFVLNGWTAIGVKSLVCLFFAIVTAPVEAHALLRAWHKIQGGKTNAPESNTL